MRKVAILTSVVFLLLSVRSVGATPVLDVKTEDRQTTQQPTAAPTTQAPPKQTTQVQPQGREPNQWMQAIEEVQNRLQTLETQAKNFQGDPKVANWLSWWWQIGFWAGIFWLFPWVFVGWQWTKFKFWGFGWPWPWWFWIPILWFIPWLWIGWQWWLVWWVDWIWIWWLWPWFFWPIWWLIVFKEAMIWIWRRQKSVS